MSQAPRASGLPPPLPATSPPTVGYHSAPVDNGWTTIATLNGSGAFHAARHLLTQHQITSRIELPDPKTEQIELQVLRTEVEWARDILQRSVPQEVEMPPPTFAFPIVLPGQFPPLPPPPMPAPSPPQPGSRAVMSVKSSEIQPASAAHQIAVTILWIVLIGILLSTIVACIFG